MLKFKNKTLFWILVLVTTVSLLLYWLGSRVDPKTIVEFIRGTGFWAPLIFILLETITYVVAPISGTPFFFAGYLVFGRWVQIYNYAAFLLAVTINFWIARRWGRRLVDRLVGRKNMERVDQFAQDYGVKSLIFLRLFQGQFHDFISYGYGLTNIKFLPYLLVSALAPIPFIALWQIYLFDKIQSFREFVLIYLVSLIPLFIVSALFVARLRKKN